MDCKTARLLLDYARPRGAELDADEARALDDHLASCETCDQTAHAEQRADEAVGKAMRQVDVPDQLRNRILGRLKEERGGTRRRRVIYGLRVAIAAAALLMLALGLWRWFGARPAFPAEQLVLDANNRVIAPPDAHGVEAALRNQGVTVDAPTDLNYGRLRWLLLTSVQGRLTPLLVFHKTAEDGARPQHALVFLLADDQFDLNALPGTQPKDAGAYEYHCATTILHPEGGKRSAYVVYYTGDDWDWLKRPLTPPATANGN